MIGVFLLWSLLASSALTHTAAAAKWGRDSKSQQKKVANKVSLCAWYISLCKLLHANWQHNQWQGTLLSFRNALALQRAFVCRGERLASITVRSPFVSHETVSEQWNTCGPEWHNSNFVFPGNEALPDSSNTRLRLEGKTAGNREANIYYSTHAVHR